MRPGQIAGINAYAAYHKPIGTNKKSSAPESNTFASILDTFIPSSSLAAAENPLKATAFWNETNHAAESVKKLVESSIGRSSASGQGFWSVRAADIKLSSADRAHAQSLISENGFFGVKQTTDRLIGFAKSLVGEDANEADIEKMRNAVQKGFDQAAKMFGGFDRLPEVSKQTYEAVMSAFDHWKSGE